MRPLAGVEGAVQTVAKALLGEEQEGILPGAQGMTGRGRERKTGRGRAARLWQRVWVLLEGGRCMVRAQEVTKPMPDHQVGGI